MHIKSTTGPLTSVSSSSAWEIGKIPSTLAPWTYELSSTVGSEKNPMLET